MKRYLSRRTLFAVLAVCLLVASIACMATVVTACRPAVLEQVSGRLIQYRSQKEMMGKVTVIANPIARTNIRLISENGESVQPIGRTDPMGYFTLETPGQGRGAAAGCYRVVLERSPHSPLDIPDSCCDPDRTPLRIEIGAGGNPHLRIIVAAPDTWEYSMDSATRQLGPTE